MAEIEFISTGRAVDKKKNKKKNKKKKKMRGGGEGPIQFGKNK